MSDPIRWIKADAVLGLDIIDVDVLAQLVVEGIIDSKVKTEPNGDSVTYLKESDLLRAASGASLKPKSGMKNRAKTIVHDTFVATLASAISTLSVGAFLREDQTDYLEEKIISALTRRQEFLDSLGSVSPRFRKEISREFNLGADVHFMDTEIEEIAESAGIPLGHKYGPNPLPYILPWLDTPFQWPADLVLRIMGSGNNSGQLDFRIRHALPIPFDEARGYTHYSRQFLSETFSARKSFLISLDSHFAYGDFFANYCKSMSCEKSKMERNEDFILAFLWNMLVLHASFERLSSGEVLV